MSRIRTRMENSHRRVFKLCFSQGWIDVQWWFLCDIIAFLVCVSMVYEGHTVEQYVFWGVSHMQGKYTAHIYMSFSVAWKAGNSIVVVILIHFFALCSILV